VKLNSDSVRQYYFALKGLTNLALHQDGSVGIVSTLRIWRPRNPVSISGRRKIVFLPRLRPHRLRGPPRLVRSRYRCYFSEGRAAGT
jgi:hypothetical protein